MKKSIILLLLLVVGVIIFFIAYTEPGKINVYEERFIRYSQLVVMFLLAFATLRLFNAIVVNNTFLNKLRADFKSLNSEMKSLVRELQDSSSTLKRGSAAVVRGLDILSTLFASFKNKK